MGWEECLKMIIVEMCWALVALASALESAVITAVVREDRGE